MHNIYEIELNPASGYSSREPYVNGWTDRQQAPFHNTTDFHQAYKKTAILEYTVGTPYNTNVGVQKIPDRAIWKPVVAKRNNTNPWSCSEPQILVTRDSRQVHMAEQPASRDRLA